MGSRDKGHKEVKKPKKSGKKETLTTFVSSPSNVEVVKKKSRHEREEEEA